MVASEFPGRGLSSIVSAAKMLGVPLPWTGVLGAGFWASRGGLFSCGLPAGVSTWVSRAPASAASTLAFLGQECSGKGSPASISSKAWEGVDCRP